MIPSQRKTKLHPRGEDRYQVLESINNNAYKIDLPREFQAHLTFNVFDFSRLDIGDDFPDSRTNPFEKGEDDKDHGVLNFLIGPITRSKAKNVQQAFNLHLQN